MSHSSIKLAKPNLNWLKTATKTFDPIWMRPRVFDVKKSVTMLRQCCLLAINDKGKKEKKLTAVNRKMMSTKNLCPAFEERAKKSKQKREKDTQTCGNRWSGWTVKVKFRLTCAVSHVDNTIGHQTGDHHHNINDTWTCGNLHKINGNQKINYLTLLRRPDVVNSHVAGRLSAMSASKRFTSKNGSTV